MQNIKDLQVRGIKIEFMERIRSTGSIYISYANPVTSFSSLTAAGLEIAKGSFYSIERTVTNVTIGSVAGGNVVVFGHYKA